MNVTWSRGNHIVAAFIPGCCSVTAPPGECTRFVRKATNGTVCLLKIGHEKSMIGNAELF